MTRRNDFPPHTTQAGSITRIYTRGLARFTTGPVIVGVMVRCGEIDNVYKVLLETDDGLAWTAFAEFCVDEGKLDLVEKRLPTIESEDAQASVCLGVATALLRLSEAE